MTTAPEGGNRRILRPLIRVWNRANAARSSGQERSPAIRPPTSAAIGALIAATTFLAAPAAAQSQGTAAAQPPDARATWFEVADRDDDDRLSRAEYLALRLNTADARFVRHFRGDRRAERTPAIERQFAAIDRNSDGQLSLTEFANVGNVAGIAPSRATEYWDWNPEYVTATFYLSVTPVRTSVLAGRKVYDASGAEVGSIQRVVRSSDPNRFYAMLALPRVSGGAQAQSRTSVGVPLDDVLLYRAGSSFLLSARGAEFLRDARGRTVAGAEPVDTLYASQDA